MIKTILVIRFSGRAYCLLYPRIIITWAYVRPYFKLYLGLLFLRTFIIKRSQGNYVAYSKSTKYRYKGLFIVSLSQNKTGCCLQTYALIMELSVNMRRLKETITSTLQDIQKPMIRKTAKGQSRCWERRAYVRGILSVEQTKNGNVNRKQSFPVWSELRSLLSTPT